MTLGGYHSRPWMVHVGAYGVSLLAVSMAALITFGVAPLQSTPTVLFVAAVIATAWFGQKGPTILAVVLSSAMVDFLFVAPVFSILVSIADLVRFAEFAMVAALVHFWGDRFRVVAARLHESNEVLETRVRERTAELASLNKSLRMEAQVRERAEGALRASEASLRLALTRVEESLREKDFLLRELQHRVKNNLQVINSLLSLQRDKIEDPHSRELFKECQERVRAIALVHQRLCGSQVMTNVDLAAYFRQLAQELVECYFVGTGKVEVQVSVDQVSLSMDALVPCALIVNELVCNALKYAFPAGRSGQIRVEVQRCGECCLLAVSDNGIGYARCRDTRQPGMGLQIVEALSDQLGGKICWECEQGTRVAITFSGNS